MYETNPVTARLEKAPSSLTQAKKADLGKRFVALVIDAVIATLVGLIPIVGGVIGGAYWLLRDGMEYDFMDRRSVGKRVMKLRPVRLDGKPMDPTASAKRNWMLALGGVVSVLVYLPLIGWIPAILLAVAGLLIGLLEIIMVLTDEQGRRLGDMMAQTIVIDEE